MSALDLVGQWRQRLQSFRGKKEPLARAFGWHKRTPSGKIIDTTAGLGRDGIIMAQLGAEVVMLERELGLACLLDQALGLASKETWFQTIVNRISIQHADAQAVIHDLLSVKEPSKEEIGANKKKPIEGFYCDPMFEHKKNKSAQNKRLMQALQSLCSRQGSSLLEETLVTNLSPSQRLVIKRAPHVSDDLQLLQYKIEGQAFRLDVHFIPKFNTLQ